MVNPCREESSDESTIISSQTSTLTRDQNQDDLQAVLGLNIQGQLVKNSDDEDDDDQESDAYGGIELSRHQEDDEVEDISDDQENGKLNFMILYFHVVKSFSDFQKQILNVPFCQRGEKLVNHPMYRQKNRLKKGS